MSLSPKAAEQALVACSRHCCLCHRFCGRNIALHHIEQPVDGVEDGFENCIPLCHGCHAEVNPYHDKGIGFTADELRGHRDNWYAKVAANRGPAQDERYITLDLDVLHRLQRMMPATGSIAVLRNLDYGASFDVAWHDDLKRFSLTFEGPEHEFLDPDLEGMAKTLRHEISEFLVAVGVETTETGTRPGVRWIAPEMGPQHREQWEAAVERLNRRAEEVTAAYDDLIRLARVKLGVLPADAGE